MLPAVLNLHTEESLIGYLQRLTKGSGHVSINDLFMPA